MKFSGIELAIKRMQEQKLLIEAAEEMFNKVPPEKNTPEKAVWDVLIAKELQRQKLLQKTIKALNAAQKALKGTEQQKQKAIELCKEAVI